MRAASPMKLLKLGLKIWKRVELAPKQALHGIERTHRRTPPQVVWHQYNSQRKDSAVSMSCHGRALLRSSQDSSQLNLTLPQASFNRSLRRLMANGSTPGAKERSGLFRGEGEEW